jgi:hypothetical protein
VDGCNGKKNKKNIHWNREYKNEGRKAEGEDTISELVQFVDGNGLGQLSVFAFFGAFAVFITHAPSLIKRIQREMRRKLRIGREGTQWRDSASRGIPGLWN